MSVISDDLILSDPDEILFSYPEMSWILDSYSVSADEDIFSFNDVDGSLGQDVTQSVDEGYLGSSSGFDSEGILSSWQDFVSSGGQQSFLDSGDISPVIDQFSSQDPIRVLLVGDDDVIDLSDSSVIPFSDVDPITPADTNGLKSVLLSVLGDYESIVTEYRYQNSGSTNYQYLRQVSPDYPWLMSAALFIVLIISVFRIAGGFLWKK